MVPPARVLQCPSSVASFPAATDDSAAAVRLHDSKENAKIRQQLDGGRVRKEIGSTDRDDNDGKRGEAIFAIEGA